MTRTLSAGMVTAAQAAGGTYFHLMSFAFSGSTLYLTTWHHDITFSGNTYQAIGGHLTHEPIQETRGIDAQSVRITLDGVDQTVIAKILQQNYIGRSAIITFAHVASDGTVTVDPTTTFSGLMNSTFEVETTVGENATTTVRTMIVSPLVFFSRRNGIQANVASHSAVYSGDTIFRHLQKISGKYFTWGSADPVFTGTGGGGGNGAEETDTNDKEIEDV